jgi:hypothetical protein
MTKKKTVKEKERIPMNTENAKITKKRTLVLRSESEASQSERPTQQQPSDIEIENPTKNASTTQPQVKPSAFSHFHLVSTNKESRTFRCDKCNNVIL